MLMSCRRVPKRLVNHEIPNNPIGAVVLLSGMTAASLVAAERECNPANIKDCDHACLVDYMNRYMDAIYKYDPKAVPQLALDVQRPSI
jgi:hypothetical protein